MEIQDIVAKANTVVTEQGLENATSEQEQVLDVAIRGYTDQLNIIAQGQASSLRKLRSMMTRCTD